MSTQTLYEQEIEYCCKKGKWKKCLCTIQIISRMENTLCAIIKESESLSIIEGIDIYGYVCGVNSNEFVFIGKKDNHSIRFKDLNRMIELNTCLQEYIYDVSYFMQLEDCKKGDSELILKDWYRFHVQLYRICLTTDNNKGNKLIKAWNIFQIGKIKLNECSLIIEIKTGKDWTLYTFYHDNETVLDKIHNALMERRHVVYKVPFIAMSQNYFFKRKSETVDLKRFNSCSNSREMKTNNRIRTLSSSETQSYDYDVSMPSTPAFRLINTYDANLSSRNHVDIIENVEPPLVFQMDSIDCGSVDSNGVYGSVRRSKTNSEGYDSVSIESEFKKKVDLERFPYEAEFKNKVTANIICSPSNLKDSNCQIDNGSITSRPNNGKFYQTLSYLKNNYKALSDVNLMDNIKRPPTDVSSPNINENKAECQCTSSLFSGNNCSSSSYLHTPSSSCNTSYENQSVPLRNYENPSFSQSKDQSISQHQSKGLISIGNISNYIEGGHSFPHQNYYNLSSHFNYQPHNNKSNSHRYYNLTDTIQSDPVDIKPVKEEDKKLNYIQLDFTDFSNPIKTKSIANIDVDNYKEIDIKNTEALKSLDGISFAKPPKKGLFRYLFKSK